MTKHVPKKRSLPIIAPVERWSTRTRAAPGVPNKGQ